MISDINASFAAFARAIYSASVEDNETVFCLELFHDFKQPFNRINILKLISGPLNHQHNLNLYTLSDLFLFLHFW